MVLQCGTSIVLCAKELKKMKMIKLLLLSLSCLPSALICADNVWLCLLGMAYAGAWMWIVYEAMNAYEKEQNHADATGD